MVAGLQTMLLCGHCSECHNLNYAELRCDTRKVRNQDEKSIRNKDERRVESHTMSSQQHVQEHHHHGPSLLEHS